MSTPWFKPKSFGYGATPVTWQGWAVTLATAAIVVSSSVLVPVLGVGPLGTLAVVVIDIAAIAALWIVGRRKTAGEWRWRWRGE